MDHDMMKKERDIQRKLREHAKREKHKERKLKQDTEKFLGNSQTKKKLERMAMTERRK